MAKSDCTTHCVPTTNRTTCACIHRTNTSGSLPIHRVQMRWNMPQMLDKPLQYFRYLWVTRAHCPFESTNYTSWLLLLEPHRTRMLRPVMPSRKRGHHEATNHQHIHHRRSPRNNKPSTYGTSTFGNEPSANDTRMSIPHS